MARKDYDIQPINLKYKCPICDETLYLNGCHNSKCNFKDFKWSAVKKEVDSMDDIKSLIQ